MRNDPAKTHIIYELPLNETIRAALRLENLFKVFDDTCHASTPLDTREAMSALLKIISVVDRPDIKSKLSQTLTQYTSALSQLKSSSHVDHTRLENALQRLSSLNHYLHTNHQRLDEALRNNEFLQQIRAQLSTPGGITDDRLPGYYLWQKQENQQKSKDLANWIKTFEKLKEITNTIMELTRSSDAFTSATAENGFYHHNLNAAQSYQLVRVKLPITKNLFPEFSAGKHRFTIRFLTPEYHNKGRATQTNQNFSFDLSCCKI